MTSNRKAASDKRVFLLFLVSATFLWFITKFAKQSLSTTIVEIVYEQLPENKLLGAAPDKLKVELAANGFEFVSYKISRPKVKIDLDKYYDGKSNQIQIDKEAIQFEISKVLDKEAVLRDASIKYIDIFLDHIDYKEVPIFVNTKINLQRGYRIKDSIELIPNKVKVSAPSMTLDSINFIETELWDLKNIFKSQEKDLKLKKPNYEKLDLELDYVYAKLAIGEFTQKSFQIPVQLINKPSDVSLMLIPEKVHVVFEIDIDYYNSISEFDFEVICDYNKRNESTGQLYTELRVQDTRAKDVRISESSIDYLIFR